MEVAISTRTVSIQLAATVVVVTLDSVEVVRFAQVNRLIILKTDNFYCNM